jgi:hypothetical protein
MRSLQAIGLRRPGAERPPDPQFPGFTALVRRKAKRGPWPQIALLTKKCAYPARGWSNLEFGHEISNYEMNGR